MHSPQGAIPTPATGGGIYEHAVVIIVDQHIRGCVSRAELGQLLLFETLMAKTVQCGGNNIQRVFMCAMLRISSVFVHCGTWQTCGQF